MFQNYLKIAWRNLFRNRLHTGVNIGGLVTGFSVWVAIFIIVYQQFQWGHQDVNGKRIYEAYKLFHDPGSDRFENSFDLGPGQAYKTEAAGVERMTRISDGG